MHSNKLSAQLLAELVYIYQVDPRLVLSLSPAEYVEFIEAYSKLEEEYHFIISRADIKILSALKSKGSKVKTGAIASDSDLDFLL